MGKKKRNKSPDKQPSSSTSTPSNNDNNPSVNIVHSGQILVPHDYLQAKQQVQELITENNKLKIENEELKQKVNQKDQEITKLNTSLVECISLLEINKTEFERLKEENALLKMDNEDLRNRVKKLEGEMDKMEGEMNEMKERIIVGEIAYAFERRVIDIVFSKREDRVRYRMKFNDIFDEKIRKSAEEEQQIEEFKNIWLEKGGFVEVTYISRALKQLKNFKYDAHGDTAEKSSLTFENLNQKLENVFNSQCKTKKYEKEDALFILSSLQTLAIDKTYPLKE